MDSKSEIQYAFIEALHEEEQVYADPSNVEVTRTGTKGDRETHVSGQMREIEDLSQHLLEAIQELERRLGDVLISSPPDAAEKVASEPRPALVPFAERLQSHAVVLRVARFRVSDMISRLEL